MTVTTIHVGDSRIVLENPSSGFVRLTVSGRKGSAVLDLKDVDIQAIATALRSHGGQQRRVRKAPDSTLILGALPAGGGDK